MPPRKRVRLEYDARRESILTNARRLFCTKPYSEVSMVELAEASGVARGLLHHYFGSKRDLYLEVVRGIVRVPTLPVPELDGPDAAQRTWDASVDGWMALIEANAELWLTIIGAGGTGRDPEIDSILDEAREHTAARALQARGLDLAAVPEQMQALVRGYGGFAEEVTREWLERGRLSRDEARAALARTLPLLIEQVLPDVLAAQAGPRRKARPVTAQEPTR